MARNDDDDDDIHEMQLNFIGFLRVLQVFYDFLVLLNKMNNSKSHNINISKREESNWNISNKVNKILPTNIIQEYKKRFVLIQRYI